MTNFILGAAGGYLLARYFIFSMEKQEYLKKEAATIDNIKNRVHDLLEDVSDLTTEEIANKVEDVTKTENTTNEK